MVERCSKGELLSFDADVEQSVPQRWGIICQVLNVISRVRNQMEARHLSVKPQSCSKTPKTGAVQRECVMERCTRKRGVITVFSDHHLLTKTRS